MSTAAAADGEVQLGQKAVPAAVFDSAGATNIATTDQPQIGALERLKKRKTAQRPDSCLNVYECAASSEQ